MAEDIHDFTEADAKRIHWLWIAVHRLTFLKLNFWWIFKEFDLRSKIHENFLLYRQRETEESDDSSIDQCMAVDEHFLLNPVPRYSYH